MNPIRYTKNKISGAVTLALLAATTSYSTASLANDNKDKKADDVEVIEVRGTFRKSFEGAIGIKRAADTVVDAITAEDIGQFSDDSIAGAIKRIPGVQVETDDSGTQGDRVSIRGLGPEFVNSTINGRRLLSSGTEARSLRQMNFNVFPSNVLGGVRVAKGQTATAPESGLAGQVDLQTLRPLEIGKLDKKSAFASISLEGRYQNVTDKSGFRFNTIAGMRNDDNTLGGYVAFVHADENNAREQLRVNSGSRTIQIDTTGDGASDSPVAGAFTANAITFNPIEETPTRQAIAAGIQFQPNDDVNVNWDLMYSMYDNQSERQSRQIQIGSTYRSTIFDNSDPNNPAVVIDENNVVRYMDYGKSTGGGNHWDIIKAFQFDNKTENLITGINVDYYLSDNLKSNFDVYYSSVDYDQDLRTTNARKKLARDGFIYDVTGEVPDLLTSNSDELEGFNYWRATIRPIELEGDNYGTTAAFNYLLDESTVLSSVDFGIHYDETNISVQSTGFHQLSPENAEQLAALTEATLPGTMIEDDFLQSTGLTSSRWFYSDFDAAVAIQPAIGTTGLEEIGANPATSYEMTESIFSLYGQANIDTEWFGLPVTGNAGLRAVLTSQNADAAQFVDGVEEPVNTESEYWEYLPSANLSFEVQENLIVRLGMSKTLTRPDYEKMAPINNIRTPEQEEGEEEGVGTARIGNPDLNPMTSINTDITVEYYTETDGAFVFSAFTKDVSDFILNNTELDSPLEGYDGNYNITTYVNYSDGTAEGFEIGFYQPFETLIPALTGFGVSSNYTYVNSSFDKDVGDAGFGFPGSSEDNFNFIAFYDEDLFSVRLAYVYRSEFFRQLAGSGAQVDSAIFTEAQGNLDFSAVLKPMENLSIRFSAMNITDENRRDFIGSDTTFLDYYDRGRTFSLTTTFNF